MKLISTQRIYLKGHQTLNEAWLQQQIAENPSIIGLGELVLKDKERIQPGAGRLDILLQDPESARRYEVEVQLGKTDEAHIIRTIEYWDIERRRYPQYEHCAVLIAEEVTSRFLNVISLFNGQIPIIAIQLSAFAVNDGVSLQFIRVVDELNRGMVDEDEEIQVPANREYWEGRANKRTLTIVDRLFSMIKTFAPQLELKYNKYYIGLADGVRSNVFVLFRPQKGICRLEVRARQSPETEAELTKAGLEEFDYDKQWGRYRLRLTEKDVAEKGAFLSQLMKTTFEREANE